jgi:hypothetical protein
LAVLLLSAVALERTAGLPARAAVALRRVEGWIVQALVDAGLELPQSGWLRDEGRGEVTREQARDRAAVAQALELLGGIPVQAERPRGYDREGWPHWLDEDGDCQDAGQEVLVVESLGPGSRRPGRLPGRVGPVARRLHGRAEPRALLARRRSLSAVGRGAPLGRVRVRSPPPGRVRQRPRGQPHPDRGEHVGQQSKGDQGLEEWLPPDPSHRCRYVADWVAVKARWRLSMDERERVSVGNLLRSCAGAGT